MKAALKLLREARSDIIGGLVVEFLLAVFSFRFVGFSMWTVGLVVVCGVWMFCAYIAFKHTEPLVNGGKGLPAFPRWRRLALIGFLAIPLFTAVALSVWWYTETHRPDQVVVLVANFYQEGTEEDPHGLTGHILNPVREALAEEAAASVRALGQLITVQQGEDHARAIGLRDLYVLTLRDRHIGQKRQTAIVIWGRYVVIEEEEWVEPRFMVVRPPGGLPEIPPMGSAVPLSELKHFEFYGRLSREMVFLTVFTVGLTHFEAGAYKEASVSFSRALAQTEELAKRVGQGAIYWYRGTAYLTDGELGQAIVDFDKAIELRPDFAEAYHQRGLAFHRRGEYESAIADYTKAIDLRSDFESAYVNRGLAYADKGEYDKALEDFKEAIELNRFFALAYYNRGGIYGELGKHDLAIADFDKVINLKPDYAEAYYNRGVSYYHTGKYDEAIADYTKAIKLKPDYADAYYNRGVAYYDKGEYDLAIADFDKVIELKPDFAPVHDGYCTAYLSRGLNYSAVGQYRKALQDYAKVIELDCNAPRVYLYRGVSYAEMNEKEAAIKDLERFLELSEDEYLRKQAEEVLGELREQ